MATTMPNRLIVFDCDGTLVDSQHNIVEAMTRAFRRHDLHDPIPEEVRRTVGLSILESVGRLLPDTPHDTLESVGEAYRTASYELRLEPDHEEPLYPGIGDMIRDLSGSNAILAVATGKSQRGLRKTLQNHDLQQYFTILKTADDGPGKPDPTCFLLAAGASFYHFFFGLAARGILDRLLFGTRFAFRCFVGNDVFVIVVHDGDLRWGTLINYEAF